MERIGYCQKLGHIYKYQNEQGNLVWNSSVRGWVRKTF